MIESMYLFHPLLPAGYNTMLICKWSEADSNSKFSFQTGCLTKAKEPILPYYPLLRQEEIDPVSHFARAMFNMFKFRVFLAVHNIIQD